MIAKTPPFMAQIIKFCCITGLRPAKAVQSVRLINYNGEFAKYYNPKRRALEHFGFPGIFMRTTVCIVGLYENHNSIQKPLVYDN